MEYMFICSFENNIHLFFCNTYPLQKNGEQTNRNLHPTLTVQGPSVHVLLAISLAFILPGLGSPGSPARSVLSYILLQLAPLAFGGGAYFENKVGIKLRIASF